MESGTPLTAVEPSVADPRSQCLENLVKISKQILRGRIDIVPRSRQCAEVPSTLDIAYDPSKIETWPSRLRGIPLTQKQGIPKSGTEISSGIRLCNEVIGCSSEPWEAHASVGWRRFRRRSRSRRRAGYASLLTMVRLKLGRTSSWPPSTANP